MSITCLINESPSTLGPANKTEKITTCYIGCISCFAKCIKADGMIRRNLYLSCTTVKSQAYTIVCAVLEYDIEVWSILITAVHIKTFIVLCLNLLP